MRFRFVWLFIAAALLLSGCVTPRGASTQEKRAAIITMKNDVLRDLYRVHPHAKDEIARAPAYAVFSNANINVILASFAGGRGVVQSRSRGRPVFMKMGELGIGLGLGIKDFRAVFIFESERSAERFITSGWEFGGHADAAAKASDKGGAVGAEGFIGGIKVYQLTKSGLALQATVKGTKYWQDDELN